MNEITVTVVGNVATEPRHVVGSTGNPRTTFRLASTTRKRGQDGRYADGTTTFFSVACFGALAINAAHSVRKGDPLVVHGTLALRDWESEGRSGRELDLTVRDMGHDLRWGRASFERPRPAAPAQEPAQGPPDLAAAGVGSRVGAEPAA